MALNLLFVRSCEHVLKGVCFSTWFVLKIKRILSMRLLSPPPPRVNTHASPALHQREGKMRRGVRSSDPKPTSSEFQRWLNGKSLDAAFSPDPKSKPAQALPPTPITLPTATTDPSFALIEKIKDLLGKDLKDQLDRLPKNLDRFRNERPTDFERIETFFNNRIDTICARLGMTLNEIRYPHRLGLYSGRLQRLLNALTRLRKL